MVQVDSASDWGDENGHSLTICVKFFVDVASASGMMSEDSGAPAPRLCIPS